MGGGFALKPATFSSLHQIKAKGEIQEAQQAANKAYLSPFFSIG